MYMKVNSIFLLVVMLLVSCTEKVQDGSGVQTATDILNVACFNVYEG